LKHLTGLLTALALAIVGGLAASWTGVPAAWFTGAMVAVSVAAVSGLHVSMPPRLIDAAMLMIGMMLGAGVTPEVVDGLAKWPVSLAVLAVSVVSCQLAVQAYLMRVGGWDRETAFFAALPGAMLYSVLGASETNADVRKVAINQLVRVFLLIAIVPALVTVIEPGNSAPVRLVATPLGMGLIVVAGTVCGLLFKMLRVPAALMTGSLLGSAALHGSGIVAGTFPPTILIAAFVVLGASVGVRFVGTTLRYLAENALPTLGAFAIAATVSGLFAFVVTLFADLPLDQIIIAFTPGGVDAMTAVALSMHMDSAYVAAHQIFRLMGVAIIGPFAARLTLGSTPNPTPSPRA
jgi:uncharacterized protein